MFNDAFTDFCISLDNDCDLKVVRTNRLLSVPTKFWRVYQLVAYCNILLTCSLVVLGVSCFFCGVQFSFLYDLVNCTDGTSISSPFCNMVVIFLLIVTLKQQQCGWSLFITNVFMVVVLFLDLFFIYESVQSTIHWLQTEDRPIIDEHWSTYFVWFDATMTVILLLIILCDLIHLSIYGILLTDCLSWQRPSTTFGHS
ncbi:hypothetical protein M3Y94_00845500 [Aphelenchoides besseyi]|nr:hypothetical protein M3Y94_00845500 [Aphelenchoides besseyi]